MVSRPVLQQPVIDAVDIRSVAEFYRELLGLHYRAGDELADGREPDSADWLVLLDDDGRRVLTFQRTEELKPSTWPSPEVPMQLHLDFTVPDRESLDAAHDTRCAWAGVSSWTAPTTRTSPCTCSRTRPATPSASSWGERGRPRGRFHAHVEDKKPVQCRR